MAYRSVCISPTDGSGGEFVGPMVAEALGFQLLNAQIVTRAAEEAGVDPAAVMDAEGRRSLAARLIGRLTDAGPSGAGGSTDHAAGPTTPDPMARPFATSSGRSSGRPASAGTRSS